MAQLSNILISLVLVGLFISGMSIFLGNVSVNYSNDEDLPDDFIDTFKDESSKTTDLMDGAREEMLRVQDDESSLFDRIGAFFRGGYDAAKGLFNSVDIFSRLITRGVGELDFLGSFGKTLSSSLGAIVLIVLIVGILLNFLIKSDKT